MRWSTEISHETGHVVIGLLMGGELQHSSTDPLSGGGGTRFDFPPALKTTDDLDRLAFASALYDLAGLGAEWALSQERIDLKGSSDDLEKFERTYQDHRHTSAFRWAKSQEFAQEVLIAMAEQCVFDHLELSRYAGSCLASHRAIAQKDISPFGKFPRPLGPGADWVSWAGDTMARARERLQEQERRHVHREDFDARYIALQAQMVESREMDHVHTRQ